MRGYELAEQLDVEYAELKEFAEEEGYELGHHMSDVDEEVAELLISYFGGDDGGTTPEQEEEETEEPAEESVSDQEKSKEVEEPEEETVEEPVEEPESEAEEEEEKESSEEGEKPRRRMRKSDLDTKPSDESEPEATPRKTETDTDEEVQEFTPPVTVRTVSEELGIPSNEIIQTLMGHEIMKTINDQLTRDDLELVAGALNKNIRIVEEQDLEEQVLEEIEEEEDEPEELEPRAPVITFLGHVDHGKTSILDEIRETRVAGGEAGGITQKVGASRIHHNGDEIVFLDTPGHEAFTSMRARGANITDLVVLVVAADDGVMPQTEESVNHARAADVPIIVAINKVDKPNADIQRTRQQVSELDLIPEDWGGETAFVNTSAETGEGIDELLDMIVLESELLELKANPDKQARGACIESRMDDQQGVTTTLLVQEGTLEVGDVILCGTATGKVRALFDDRENNIEQVKPSEPAVVLGLDEPPEAGEPFYEVEDETEAREIVEGRKEKTREEALARQSKKQSARLSNILDRLDEEEEKFVNLVVKAGTDGACEVLVEALENQEVENASVEILHSGVGTVSESDVLLADASEAIVLGFQTGVEHRAREVAEEKDVEIRTYDVIYRLLEDIENALLGVLEPETVRNKIGQLNVKETFNITGVGRVAGCYVADGKITNDSIVQVYRDKEMIHEGEVDSLKRFQEDQKEVKEGYECGVRIRGFEEVNVGDILQVFEEEEVLKTTEAKA